MDSVDRQIKVAQHQLNHLRETRKQIVEEIQALVEVREMLTESIQKHVAIYKEVSGNLQATLQEIG